MTTNQSLLLLRMLDGAEQTAFGKFLQSRFFTNQKFLYPLFLELRKLRAEPNFDEKNPPDAEKNTARKTPGKTNAQFSADADDADLDAEQRRIFEKIFQSENPGAPTDARPKSSEKQDAARIGKQRKRKWNSILSDLNLLLREFLLVRQTLREAELKRQATASALFRLQDKQLFFREIELSWQAIEAEPERTNHWAEKIRLQQMAIEFPEADRLRDSESALETLDTCADVWHCLLKLQLACDRFFRSRMLLGASELPDVVAMFENANRLRDKSTLLKLYLHLFNLLNAPGHGTADFDLFIQALQENAHRIAPVECSGLVRYCFNYLNRLNRKGDPEAANKWFELLEWSDKTGIWEGSPGAEELFLNQGVGILAMKRFDLMPAYLKTRAKMVPPERRESALAILMAYWHFHAEAFEKINEHLMRVTTRHPRYTLLFHSMEVRSVYEMALAGRDDFGRVSEVLENFERFIRRNNTFSPEFLRHYDQLIWFIREFSKWKNPGARQLKNRETLLAEMQIRQPALASWVKKHVDRLPA